MKSVILPAAFVALCLMLSAQTPDAGKKAPASKLVSTIYDWTKMEVTPTPTGVRRALFDGPTATVDLMHCHITTLNPGTNSGEPRLHTQEEVIIVKEGQVEMSIDGKTQAAGPGSVFFLAANATTRLRNVGDGPCTYYVIYYRTALTAKG